jgi:hypothetical protein
VRLGQLLDRAFRFRVEGDAAHTPLGCGEEQLADGRVGQVIGDVEDAFGGSPLAESAVDVHWNAHAVLLLSRRTPDEAAWRAAASLEPSAAAISA